jgi:hypothetical protein
LLSHLIAKMANVTTADFDTALARLSRRQHGAFSRAQVLAAGGSKSLIHRRVATKTWVRLSPGVYALAAANATWERQVMAATLVHHGLVAAAGSTAAALHGADGFRRLRPQLLIAHTLRPGNPLATVRRTRHLVAADISRVAGIPTLTVERLVVDLAPEVDKVALSRLVDQAVIRKKFDPEKLLNRAGSIFKPGQRESVVLSELLAERWTGKPPAASELEGGLYEILDAAGYRGYIRQATPPWFEPALGGVVVDSLFPDDRVILEGDGRLWHARLEQWERDHQRDAVALAHGYLTIRVTWRMVTRSPSTVTAALAPWIRRAA